MHPKERLRLHRPETVRKEVLKTKRNAGKDTHRRKKQEIENKVLAERLSHINTQVYASSKSLKGTDRKKSFKDGVKDEFDGIDNTAAERAIRPIIV